MVYLLPSLAPGALNYSLSPQLHLQKSQTHPREDQESHDPRVEMWIRWRSLSESDLVHSLGNFPSTQP